VLAGATNGDALFERCVHRQGEGGKRYGEEGADRRKDVLSGEGELPG